MTLRSLRSSFYVVVMGLGPGDEEGLFSVGFVRDGARRKQNDDMAFLIHGEVCGLIDGHIVRQRRFFPDGEVDYVGGLVHAVPHLHGDGLDDVCLLVLAAEFLQRGGAVGRCGLPGLDGGGAARGQHQQECQQSGQRGEKPFHKIPPYGVLSDRRGKTGKSLPDLLHCRIFASKNEKIMDKNGSICEREKIKIHFTEMLDD